MLPVYLFAYANDDERHLASLKAELKTVGEGLDPLASNQELIYKNDISTTSGLANALLNYQRVCAFHFAGHADSHQLMFEDSTADIKGIVPMLKLQEELFLVVLNGCSTEGQVERLLQAGIQAVIATQRLINDESAQKFAQYLWAALGKDKSLGDSFDFALHELLGRPESKLEFEVENRGVGWERKGLVQKQDQGNSNWVLWYRPDNKTTVKEWKLPRGNKPGKPVEEPEEHAPRYQTNKALTSTLFKIVDLYRPERLVSPDGTRYTENEEGQYLSELQENLYKALPYPIGVQIRQLLASDYDKDRKINAIPKTDCYIGITRLKKLINAFDITTELLLYVLMAQLWRGLYERKHEGKDFRFPDACRQILRDYFNRSDEEFRKMDVMPIIKAIREVLYENHVEIFVDEIKKLKELIDNDLKFREAYGFLQRMKQFKIENQLKSDYRQETENQFIYLLSKLGFMTRYYLLNVGDIKVKKRLHFNKRYNHFLIALDYNIDEKGDWDGDQYNHDCFDDNSILLTKINYTNHRHTSGPKSPEKLEYLNLSPFVIDQNALTEMDDVDVLFFESYNKEQQTFLYKQINNFDSEILLSASGRNAEKNLYYEEQQAKRIWDVFNEFVNVIKHDGTGQDAPQPV